MARPTLQEQIDKIMGRKDIGTLQKEALIRQLQRQHERQTGLAHHQQGQTPLSGGPPIRTGMIGNTFVRHNEVGVKVTFGRIDPQPRRGFQFEIGDASYLVRMDTRVRVLPVNGTFLTRSGLSASLGLQISYRLNPHTAPQVAEHGFDETIGGILAPAAAEATRRIIAVMDEEQLLNPQLSLLIEHPLRDLFGKTGFILEGIAISNIGLPEEIRQLLAEMRTTEMRAALAERQARVLQAQIPVAQGEAELEALKRIIAARAEAEGIRIKGQAVTDIIREIADEVLARIGKK